MSQRGSVYNLSGQSIPDPVYDLLNKGLKFVPTNPSWHQDVYLQDVNDFIRKIKLKMFYAKVDSDDSSDDHTTPDGPQNVYKLINRPQKGSWDPSLAALKDEDIALIKDLKTALNCVYPKIQRDNLTKEERKAFSYLKNAPELIVKPADKGSSGLKINISRRPIDS